MQPRKSPRHVRAANARWRNAEAKAQADREGGIPDLPMPSDLRQPFFLPLAHLGFKDLHVEPRRGYVSWRAIDVKTGLVMRCAALKELFRWIAKQLPKMLAERNFQ